MSQNNKLDKKALKDKFEAQITGAIPSQIPVHATRASYQRMLQHCQVRDKGNVTNFWGCVFTGEPVRARMVRMNIYDKETGARIDYAPVVTLYCSVCDKVPLTRSGDSIFSSELQTLSM